MFYTHVYGILFLGIYNYKTRLTGSALSNHMYTNIVGTGVGFRSYVVNKMLKIYGNRIFLIVLLDTPLNFNVYYLYF